ncbi:PKD domain-containing protein [uncultured Paraglaciecola sp.]|uniref:HzsA-related protein n=1 Tax=uncultured Paraglaciecola sp. TaxID=1765024 RepID=UPI00261341AA|nr:PKD domain-containing protein [uncultured Paraglaciecola sp.]
MIRFAVILLFLFISAPIFAETPIVYSKCKATTATHTITRDVLLGDTNTVNVTKEFRNLDVYDVIPDVTNFLTNFSAPCDLVYRDAAGVETVIHDCSTSGSVVGQSTCAALDGAVSFDGTQITYALFEGTLFNFTHKFNNRTLHNNAVSDNTNPTEVLPNTQISTTGAHLRTYTVAGGANFDLTPSVLGRYDSGPAYIANGTPNGRVAFTSNRTGHTTNMVFRTNTSRTGYAIHSVERDGTNITLDSHHGRSQEQHPIQLKNGTLAYSTWQIGAGMAMRKGNSQLFGSTTLGNMFKIWGQRSDGTLPFPILGQHTNDTGAADHGEDHNALHNCAETTDGRLWCGNYYRQNNQALGVITGVVPEPAGREGQNPLVASINNAFFPNVSINLADWATNRDNMPIDVSGFPSTVLDHPTYAAPLPWHPKIGFPFALPSNVLGLVVGSGACSVVANANAFNGLTANPPSHTSGNGEGVMGNLVTEVSNAMIVDSLSGDIPGCNLGIYKTTVIPSVTFEDLTVIVDTKEWHEIYPRAVVPYTDIHGVAQPATLATPKSSDLPTGSPFAMLGSASITDRETEPKEGIRSDPFDFAHLHSFHMQGTDTIDYTDADLCGVRIVGQLPNTSVNVVNQISNVFGERQWILGEFNVRNRLGNGNPIIDASGNEDTSFMVRMPANMSYTMAGLDCDGRLLNMDQTWQSLKPGEEKTCGGCHVHSRDTRITFAQSHAATSGYVPFVLGEGTVPLMNGLDGNGDPIVRTETGYGYLPDFNRDIKPILQARCVSCHEGGGSPGAGSNPRLEADLVLDNYPADNETTTSTWYRLVKDNSQSNLSGSPHRFGSATYFARPWLTKYMKAFDSRGSLLYWKAANQRTDNRTDVQFSDDIDFGASHPTSITNDELGTLARWIEMGAPGGSQELLDTHDPTLVMTATVPSTDTISELVIGTVDLGTGIDVSTLNVCLRNGGTCTNIAPSAQLHGITTISIGSNITDMNQVIEASVSDVQGNTTTLIHTAQFLVDGGSSGTGTPSTLAINAGGNATVNEGDTFSRTVTFSDGEDTNSDGWTVVVDWNGVTENINVGAGLSSFNISRLMPTAGSVPVTVTITDDTGETAQGSFTITVNSSGGGGGDTLVIDTGGDAYINEGDEFTRTVSVTDSDGNGGSYTVDWGSLQTHNGTISAGATSFDITRVMPDGDAIMTVNVTATDIDGGTSAGSFNLTTLNVNPRAAVTSGNTVAVDTLYTLTYTVSDPGQDTITLTSVDWGDGTFNNELTHTYTQVGAYKVKIQVIDEDGVHTIARHTLTVQ